jgi:hypothetical protein
MQNDESLMNSVHCTVPMPSMGCEVPSVVWIVSLCVGEYLVYDSNSSDVPATCFDAPESRIQFGNDICDNMDI